MLWYLLYHLFKFFFMEAAFHKFCTNYFAVRNSIEVQLQQRSTNEVHFHSITASLKHGKLMITWFIKLTGCLFYLNPSSCHTSHVLKIYPKEQLTSWQSVCSKELDYLLNSKIMCTKFIEGSFHEKYFKNNNKASNKNR